MTYKRGDMALYQGKEVHIDLVIAGKGYQVSWQDASRGGRQTEVVALDDLSDIPPYISPAQERYGSALERCDDVRTRMDAMDKVGKDEMRPIFSAVCGDLYWAIDNLRKETGR